MQTSFSEIIIFYMVFSMAVFAVLQIISVYLVEL